MENTDKSISLASNERMLKLIEEAENELSAIRPEINYLEECQKKLAELKEQQFKLNSLIISLQSLNKMSGVTKAKQNLNIIKNDEIAENLILNNLKMCHVNNVSHKIFLPDVAISDVKNHLRTHNNLNYEIFKSVVFNSGIATTEEIKQYLIENKIKQPKTGKTFEEVELKEISSRTNYLVRKNILISVQPGIFRSSSGWTG